MSEFELGREETEEIDAKVGRIHSQFTAIENEMTELLERVKELEHQAMDERLLAIVKAVAFDTAAYCDDWLDVNCAFCSASNETRYIGSGLPEIKHTDDCKVTLARIILKELDTPVKIYKVTFEVHEKPVDYYVLATNEEEAIQEYKLQHNVRVTLTREL